MADAATDDADEPVPVDALLAGAAAELARLAESGRRIEETVCALLDGGAPPWPERQEIDPLIQHLDGLATYLDALAATASGCGEIDRGPARRRLTNAVLRRRLAGRSETGDEAEARAAEAAILF